MTLMPGRPPLWQRLLGGIVVALVALIGGNTLTATAVRAADGPAVVKNGAFVNAVETGSGTATIYQLADNSYLLRLEDFRVDNGPDLREELVAVDGSVLDLGGLKGNRGNQNYALPDYFDPALYDTARIYCRAVHIVMIVAPLTTPTAQ